MADKSDSTRTRRGPSPSLLITGLIALLISAWAIIGPIALPAGSAFPFGWILVITAIVIGGLLVLSAGRRR